MNDPMLRALLKRIQTLEDTRPRIRRGDVVTASPLVITLAGGTVELNVDYLASYSPTIGDHVKVVSVGGDMFVLGAVA